MDISFASVLASDADALADLRVEAMRESLERVGRFDPARARARLLDGFAPGHTRWIVAGGERVGFFVLRPQEQGLLLDHLYIRPGSQGRGTGAAAVQAILAEADARRCDLHVVALRESDANRFYVRHGFRLLRQEAFDNYYVRHAA